MYLLLSSLDNQDRIIYALDSLNKDSINDSPFTFIFFHINQKPLLNGEINTIEKVNENMQMNSAMQF